MRSGDAIRIALNLTVSATATTIRVAFCAFHACTPVTAGLPLSAVLGSTRSPFSSGNAPASLAVSSAVSLTAARLIAPVAPLIALAGIAAALSAILPVVLAGASLLAVAADAFFAFGPYAGLPPLSIS